MADSSDPKQAALDIIHGMQKDLEEFEKTGDRQVLVAAFKDQFLANRHRAAATTEDTRQQATRILVDRLAGMSDNMLLRTIETLARIGDSDVQSLFGMVPGGRNPVFALNQFISPLGGGAAPQLAANPSANQNPVRDTANILEAIEHLSAHFGKNKALAAPKDDIIDAEIVGVNND